MESEPLLQFVLFVVLLVISALVSGSETAFFSLSELDIERLRDLGNKRSKRVVKLRSDPRRLLIVILTRIPSSMWQLRRSPRLRLPDFALLILSPTAWEYLSRLF